MGAHCHRSKDRGPGHGVRSRGATAGFALLAVLGLVAATGIGLAYVGKQWQTSIAREQESELVWVGQQYRNAIRRHFALVRQYPLRLEELLLLPNASTPRPNLRKLYSDPTQPLGDASAWQVLMLGERIVGVASVSERAPFKTAEFEWQDRALIGKTAYREWRFTHPPELADDPRIVAKTWTADTNTFKL